MATRRSALLLTMMMTMMMTMMAVSTMKLDAVAGKEVAAKFTNANQTEAAQFLEMYNREGVKIRHRTMEVHWALWTNITTENQNRDLEADMELSKWDEKMITLANQFDASGFPASMKRQFSFIQTNGTGTFSEASNKKLLGIMGDMKTIYSTAKVCLEENRCLPLEPDITRTLQTSRDEALLRRLWTGWRDASGKKVRDLFTQYVALGNEAAHASGYADRGAHWRSRYETDSFEQDVAALFEELRPFYQQLHAFVRRRLKQQYGEDVFPSSGHIPAHLLGNMWAQKWNNLQDLLMPFPDKPNLDITEEMLKQNYTARKIFETADEFFTSLRLEPMSREFWDKSMLEKPADGREVVCHASASNFYTGKDVRIKQCTEVNTEYFITAHHEMGHAEYYLLYNHLPFALRQGANPGFHEAVGDTIALSVQTPKHLHNIGLLPSSDKSHEADLNFLMAMALQKVAFLPFGYLIDQWRWSVFRGDTSPENYNQAWWDLRCKLQGVSAPVKRTEEDFDPGAKYHVADDTPYIRYFVSYVIQFQFHKALCEAAGHQGPLHTCDIYNSTRAGDKLRAMLSKGRSEVWTEPFKALTGQSQMSLQPLMEYFQPLMDHLQSVNSEEDVGWSDACP